MTDQQQERIKTAFNGAFKRMCAAATIADLESELSNALNQLYRLGELNRKRMGNDAAYWQALKGSSELRAAGAAMWARKFDVHEAVVVGQTADLYSDYYTNMYGVPAWNPLSALPEQTEKFDRHLAYASELEGRPVLDTLKRAFIALEALRRDVLLPSV